MTCVPHGVQAADTSFIVKFTVVVTYEAPWFVAKCLDADGEHGKSVDEALANLEEALANLEEALSLCFEVKGLADTLEPPIITTSLFPA
jgi:predicted RNase H-like HicB family nuclease